MNKKSSKSLLQGTSDLISSVDIKKIVVIELGSFNLRIGVSGQNKPLLDLPYLIARSKNVNLKDPTKTHLPDVFGKKCEEALRDKPDEYELIYPAIYYKDVDERIKALENFLRYVFEEILCIETVKIDLLIVDSISKGTEFRIKLMEMLFECLKVQSVNFVNSVVSSLFTSGRTTGINIEIGNSTTNVVPIYEGLVLTHAKHVSQIGGQESTNLIQEYLKSKEIDLISKHLNTTQVIHNIKQSLSFCSNNYEREIKDEYKLSIPQKCFELPDGEIIELNNESIFKSGEILLRPSLIDQKEMNLDDKIYDAIGRVEDDLKRKLADNLVLTGGASQTNNLYERLSNDLNINPPSSLSNYSFELTCENNRPLSGWIGGSMLGSISTFQKLKIDRSVFEEESSDRNMFLFKKIL